MPLFYLLFKLCLVPALRVLYLNSIESANPHVVKHLSVIFSACRWKFIEFLYSFQNYMHELDVETGSEESRNGLSLQPFFVFFNDDAKALQNELFAKKSEYWLIKSNSREQKTS